MSTQPASSALRIAKPAAVPPVISKGPAPAPAKVAARLSKIRHPGRRASEGLFRGLIVLILLISVGIALWSFGMVLIPRQDQARRLNTELSRVSAAIDDLERVWNEAEALQTSNKLNEAKSLLFADEQALASWMGQLDQQAAPFAIGLNTAFRAPAQQDANSGIAIIPTTVAAEIQPPAEGSLVHSRYQRLLQLVKQVTESGRRADLTELTVTGGTNSAERAVLVLNLWAKESK